MSVKKEPSEAKDSDAMPLSERELKDVRAMIEQDKRVAWLWSTIRTWATWVTAVGAAIVIGWDSFKRVFLALIGAGH